MQNCRNYCQDLGNTPIGSASPVNDYDPNNRALRKLLTSIDELGGLTPNEFGSAAGKQTGFAGDRSNF